MNSDAEPDEIQQDAPMLLRLSEEDRARLGEALQELLAHGSILGLDAGRSALYHWCRQYFDWVKEAAALVDALVLQPRGVVAQEAFHISLQLEK